MIGVAIQPWVTFPKTVCRESAAHLSFGLGSPNWPAEHPPIECFVCIQARQHGFEITSGESDPGSQIMRVSLVPNAAGEAPAFELTAQSGAKLGSSTMTAHFFATDGSMLGLVRIKTRIVGKGSPSPDLPRVRRAVGKRTTPSGRHPDLVLHVSQRDGMRCDLAVSRFDGSTLQFIELGSFEAPKPTIDVNSPITESALTRYLGDAANFGDWSMRSENPRTVGRLLWSKLGETKFADLYWTGLGGIAPMHDHQEAWSVLVSSDEFLFPWELVLPVDAGDVAAPRMLGQAFAISRWEPGRPLTSRVIVSGVTVVAPEKIQPNLFTVGSAHAAITEVEVLSEYARLLQVRAYTEMMLNSLADVTGAMRRSPEQVFHLRSHGGDNGLKLYVTKDGELQELTNEHFKGLFRRGRGEPVIVLNMCGAGTTDDDTWRAALVRSGCAACIVTSWNVDVSGSAKVMARFYGALTKVENDSPVSIAEAMRRVRDAFRLTVPPAEAVVAPVPDEPVAFALPEAPLPSREAVKSGLEDFIALVPHFQDVPPPPLDPNHTDGTPLAYVVFGHPNATITSFAAAPLDH